ncbi:MAG TPA: phosphonate ABC transporter, permease protein PhnE, partial [Rhodoferax sp.]|nr:phosphonate ABC transporter, permease protein PhnE [Rhodoferax sp.]
MQHAASLSTQTTALAAVPKRSLGWHLSWAVLIGLLLASWKGADMRPLDLWRDSGNMATYVADFFPPNFSQWRMYVEEMVVTLQIALWGTALAVITAIPMALMASANLVP